MMNRLLAANVKNEGLIACGVNCGVASYGF